MSLGMAEYRSGHFAVADAALKTATNGVPAIPSERQRALVSGIAAFYQAMSLMQQARTNEARNLIAATEAVMKPLPSDDDPDRQ